MSGDTRLRLLEAARSAFAREGYAAADLAGIATAAGVPLAALHAEFPTRTSFGLAIYRDLLDDLEARIGELPEGGLGARFGALLAQSGLR